MRKYFNRLYYWATCSNIDEIVKLAKTIDKNFSEIMEAIKRNLNNGVVEGMNNKSRLHLKDHTDLRLKNIEIRLFT